MKYGANDRRYMYFDSGQQLFKWMERAVEHDEERRRATEMGEQVAEKLLPIEWPNWKQLCNWLMQVLGF